MAIPAVSLMLAMVLQAAPESAPGDWKSYTSAPGGFSVQLPGPPQSQVTTQQTPAGPIRSPMLVYKDGGVAYIAMRVPNPTPVPKAQQKEFFDGVRGSFAQGDGKKLLNENRQFVNGVPAADFEVEVTAPGGGEQVQRARFLLWDEKTSYSLMVIAPKGQDTEKEARKFFASLKTVQVNAAEAATEPAAGAKPKWRTFNANAAGFSIRMPDKPSQNSQTQKTPDGDLEIKTFMVDMGTRAFTASVYNFPEKLSAFANDPTREKALANLCNGVVTGMKGKILELSPIKLGSVTGREFQFSFPGPTPGTEGLASARAYFDGSKAYLTMVVGEQGQVDSPDTKTFLRSFKLLDEDKAPAKTKPARPKAARPKTKN